MSLLQKKIVFLEIIVDRKAFGFSNKVHVYFTN
jgi:hypothetical protein